MTLDATNMVGTGQSAQAAQAVVDALTEAGLLEEPYEPTDYSRVEVLNLIDHSGPVPVAARPIEVTQRCKAHGILAVDRIPAGNEVRIVARTCQSPVFIDGTVVDNVACPLGLDIEITPWRNQ